MNKILNTIIITLSMTTFYVTNSSALAFDTTKKITIRHDANGNRKIIKQSKKVQSKVDFAQNSITRNLNIRSETIIEPTIKIDSEVLKNVFKNPEVLKLIDELDQESAAKFLSILENVQRNSSSGETTEKDQANNSSLIAENPDDTESSNDNKVLIEMIENSTDNIEETKTNKVSSGSNLKTKLTVAGLTLATATAAALWKSDIINSDTIRDPEMLKDNLMLLKNEVVSKAIEDKNSLVEMSKSSISKIGLFAKNIFNKFSNF